MKKGYKKGGRKRDKRSKRKGKKLKFMPVDPNSQVAQATYSIVKEAILKEIASDFGSSSFDIMTCLEQEVKLDLKGQAPKLEVSVATNAKVKAFENELFQEFFEEDIRSHRDRVKQLEACMFMAYDLIWNKYMSFTMQNRIKLHPDYDEKIKGDPVELLLEIRLSMYGNVRTQLPLITAISVMEKFLNYKQGNEVSMAEYIKTFKDILYVFKMLWGTHITDGFAEKLSEYQMLGTDEEKDNMKDAVFEKWIATVFIKNANERRYGSILSELAQSYVRGRDEYPKDLWSAINFLYMLGPDPAY
jgi:hypothetical protein